MQTMTEASWQRDIWHQLQNNWFVYNNLSFGFCFMCKTFSNSEERMSLFVYLNYRKALTHVLNMNYWFVVCMLFWVNNLLENIYFGQQDVSYKRKGWLWCCLLLLPDSQYRADHNRTVLAWMFHFHMVLSSTVPALCRCVNRAAQYSSAWRSLAL